MSDVKEFFDSLARVLLRCWVFGVLLLTGIAGALIGLREQVVSVHSELLQLSGEQLNLLYFEWLGMLKLIVIGFFFVPWLAIKLTRFE